jgi:hypothetical protein
MSAVSLMLLLDGLMIALLFVTVVYCLKLNTRIRVLQDSKADFGKLIERFDMTTQRAQQSIEDLQNISKKVNEQLSGRLDKANFLADDLAFMIEKGGKLADKMEGRVTGRSPMPQSSASVNTPQQPADRRPNMGGPALRENNNTRNDAQEASDRKRASLEAMLNRSNTRSEDGVEDSRRRPGASARLRSKAEQELYDAMKAGGNS